MNKRRSPDIVRQAANVVGAVSQFAVPTLTFRGDAITRLDEANPSLVVPGDYTFTIWTLIFVLSLAYAVYQALPANRESTLLRRVGPFTAGAFLLNALWCALVPAGQFFASLVVLAGILACLALAFAGLARTARERHLGTAERLLVALPLGPFFGWITTANTVSLPSGIVQAGTPAEAAVGGVALILGGLLASAVVLAAAKSAPATFYLADGGSVLWGLAGVVVAQYDRSLVTSGAASLAAVVLALVLLEALRNRRWGSPSTPPPNPGSPDTPRTRAPAREARAVKVARASRARGGKPRLVEGFSVEAAHDHASAENDSLTSRPLSGTRMAASGLSNREIGRQLYLSHRTVGAHLYRAFPKLRITSRGLL